MFFKTPKEKLRTAGFEQTGKYRYQKSNETTYVIILLPNDEERFANTFRVKPETRSLKDIDDIKVFYYLGDALNYAETLLYNKTIEYKRRDAEQKEELERTMNYLKEMNTFNF